MRDRNKGMGGIGDKTANDVNSELKDEELKLLTNTTIDWEALKPQVADKETYDKLIAIVNDSTNKNENMAKLQERIKGLGVGAISIAKKVVELIK